jgi:hypothetical protein
MLSFDGDCDRILFQPEPTEPSISVTQMRNDIWFLVCQVAFVRASTVKSPVRRLLSGRRVLAGQLHSLQIDTRRRPSS